MARKRHSAGPWRQWPDFDEDDQTGWTIIGTADGYALFCTCGANPADTSLCLVAPELLAALEKMLICFQTHSDQAAVEACSIAHLVIAKAKGGAA